MPRPGRSRALDLLLPSVLAVTVLCFSFGSSSVVQLSHVGSVARWVALAVALALALTGCMSDGVLRPRPHDVVAAGLVCLAAVSAAWSVDPGLTLRRAASLLLLFATAAALAAWVGFDTRRAVLVPLGVTLGAVAVVVAGYVLYLIDPHAALQAQSIGQAWRFRGIGQNPNTTAMLAAVAMPATAVGALAWRRASSRFAAVAALGLLATQIGLSGSRGAMVAAVAGGCGAAVLAGGPRFRRGVVLVLVLAFLTGSAAVENRAPSGAGSTPPPPAPSVPSPALPPATAGASQVGAAAPAAPGYDVLAPTSFGACRPEDEIGRPQPGDQSTDTASSGVASSGRIDAWAVALRQAAQRPVAGYGFGTEERVFYSCFYFFQGTRPENTYIGVVLQLGAVGLLALVALVLSLAVPIVRVLRRHDPAGRAVAAVGASTLGAGLVLMLVQSYSLSVGNTATAALWLTAAAGASVGARPVRAGKRTVAVVAIALAALVPIGRWESRAQLGDELHGLARVRAEVGALDSSTLSALRPSSSYRCLDYRRGVRPYALELCFDRKDRLLEASDRRGAVPEVYTLRLDPMAATVMLPLRGADVAVEKVRRRVTLAIWTGPARNLGFCARLASDARRASLAQRPRLAAGASAWCRDAVRAATSDAHSAGVIGSSAVRSAAASAGVLLEATARLLAGLQTHPSALQAYDVRAKSLGRRKSEMFRALRAREPWLRVSP